VRTIWQVTLHADGDETDVAVFLNADSEDEAKRVALTLFEVNAHNLYAVVAARTLAYAMTHDASEVMVGLPA
jgi:hypothetical protein